MAVSSRSLRARWRGRASVAAQTQGDHRSVSGQAAGVSLGLGSLPA